MFAPVVHPLHDIFFLEYLHRGSLHTLLCNMCARANLPPAARTRRPKPIPDRALWLMFQCMVQACVGLEHQPLRDPQFGHLIDADGLLNGNQPFSERVPPAALMAAHLANNPWTGEGARPGGTGMVHYDIDPQNGGSPLTFSDNDLMYFE